MPDQPVSPLRTPAAGPLATPPAARSAGRPASPGGPSFSDLLAQSMPESEPAGAESTRQVQQADQRLGELRADLDQVRRRVQQLQAFQAQAIRLYQQQARFE